MLEAVAKTQCGNGAAAVAKGSHKSQKSMGGSVTSGADEDGFNNLSSSGGTSSEVNQVRNWDRDAESLMDRPGVDDVGLQAIQRHATTIAKAPPEDRVLVTNQSGTVVAGAKVSSGSDHIYVSAMATNPSNFTSGRKGGGTAVMAAIVKKSMRSGFKGKVQLLSDPDKATMDFYKKIGFKSTDRAGSMTLSPEAAQKFLNNYEKKYGKLS